MSAHRRTFIVLLLVAVAGSACTRERRHEVMTLFFDGVPPLDAPTDAGGEVTSARLPETNAERVDALGYALETTRVVTHKPVADRQCSSCHEVNDRSSRPAGSWVSGTAMLRMPVEELCVACHPQEDPVQHGPAAAGQCVICHHPHASQNPHLLRLSEPEKVCNQCHLPVDIAGTAGHADRAPDQSCLECHDPHGGTVAGFLRGAALPPAAVTPTVTPTVSPLEEATSGQGGDDDR